MECAAFEAKLPGLVDGALDDQTTTAMAAHLQGCPACAALSAAHRMVSHSLSQAEPVPAPAGFEARLFAAVRREEAAVLLVACRRRQARVAAAVLAGLIPVYAGLAGLWVEHGSPRLAASARWLAGSDPLAALVRLWHQTAGVDLAGALQAALAALTDPVHLPVADIAVHPLCLAAVLVALGVWLWYESTTLSAPWAKPTAT